MVNILSIATKCADLLDEEPLEIQQARDLNIQVADTRFGGVAPRRSIDGGPAEGGGWGSGGAADRWHGDGASAAKVMVDPAMMTAHDVLSGLGDGIMNGIIGG